MAQRLQDQSDGLPTARRTTVYADVGRGLEKRGLRSGLRRDRGSWRWRHWSPAARRGGRSGDCRAAGGVGERLGLSQRSQAARAALPAMGVGWYARGVCGGWWGVALRALSGVVFLMG